MSYALLGFAHLLLGYHRVSWLLISVRLACDVPAIAGMAVVGTNRSIAALLEYRLAIESQVLLSLLTRLKPELRLAALRAEISVAVMG